ncbi:hypothetical protein AVEN_199718-1 [Araneus ventricosus]|uniref:Uncharacterized protein n=1 Tax=Araneus ventricosus TaxID=182803 RepID=A0A4Y2AB18_ARAVE|nr:hypothetical protein AVEN_65842-1 [Araneus ventricosus]GBL76426.1 hypothetical protein AVEN_199718-1 [Araneus ventricosus]
MWELLLIFLQKMRMSWLLAERVAIWGFPFTRKEIKITVSDFVIKNKECTNELAVRLQKYCRFKDDIPEEDWMSSFMHRHNLSAEKSSILKKSQT